MHAFGRLGEGDEGQELSNRLTGEHMSRFAQRHDKTDNANIRARLPRTSRDLGDLDDDDYGYHGRAVSEFLPSVPHPPSAPPSPPYLQPEPSANSQRDQQNQNLLPRLLRSQHVPYYEPHQKSSKRGQYSRQPPPSFRRADPSYEDDWPIAPSEFHVNGISRTRATVVDSPESTVGRLAGRFNSDTRSSPLHRPMAQLTPGLGGGMAGVLAGPLSPSGSMPRMSPHSTMPLPTAQPKIATIPIASVVPRIPELPAMRRYGVDMDPYMSRQPLQRGRSFEQDPIAETTRGAARYEETGKLKFGPGGLHSSRQQSHRSRSRPMESSARRTSKVPQSELAGLTGPGSGMDRVREWREYIGDESSDQDSASDTE
ncbi:hypothetical protein SEPCBS119000_002020 [Sporothrix epigloea]|uniref:Spindle poison sensitivity protein n=1 Tax=Sporothrix epigloea TaxID=1892477 RepID=A0ABP0DDW5_9PEZI